MLSQRNISRWSYLSDDLLFSMCIVGDTSLHMRLQLPRTHPIQVGRERKTTYLTGVVIAVIDDLELIAYNL